MSPEKSLIGKEFTYKGINTIILDEAKIRGMDNWKLCVTITTDIYRLTFSIIDLYTYINFNSVGPLNEIRARELLVNIFDTVSKFKGFKGSMANNLWSKDDDKRFEIYIINEEML